MRSSMSSVLASAFQTEIIHCDRAQMFMRETGWVCVLWRCIIYAVRDFLSVGERFSSVLDDGVVRSFSRMLLIIEN